MVEQSNNLPFGKPKEILTKREFLKLLRHSPQLIAGAVILSHFSPLNKVNPWEHRLPEPNSKTRQLLLIADTHAAHHDLNARQLNSHSIVKLSELAHFLRGCPFDLLIQMGDLIQEENLEAKNLDTYQRCQEALQQFSLPYINLLGNHDLYGASLQNLTEINHQHTPYAFRGVQSFDNFQIAWLDVNLSQNKVGSLSQESLSWLEQIIYKDTPTFIFSHYGLIPQDVRGNYYFENDPRPSALTNGIDVWNALKGLPVHIISGHLHWSADRSIGNSHHITVPAFVENIASSEKVHPAIYSILSITDINNFTLSSFFGSTCLNRLQVADNSFT